MVRHPGRCVYISFELHLPVCVYRFSAKALAIAALVAMMMAHTSSELQTWDAFWDWRTTEKPLRDFRLATILTDSDGKRL